MEMFCNDDLIIEVAEPHQSGIVRLDWKGKSVARTPSEVLQPLFESVTRRASENGCDLEMHFEEIEHFNSSTITALIGLIQRLKEARTRLTIFFDPALKWQKISFDALRVFESPDGLFHIQALS